MISTGGIIFLRDYNFGNIFQGYIIFYNAKIVRRGYSLIKYNINNFSFQMFKCTYVSEINFNTEVMSQIKMIRYILFY